MSKVTVKFDPGLERRLHGASDRGQKILDAQVMKDTDPYVPMDSGTLKDSVIRASVPGSGKIVYEAPYAVRHYYSLPNKSRDKHPLAVMRWFEAAKAVNKSKWLQVAKKAGGSI